MLCNKHLTLASRSYYLISFLSLFLHFKFLVFFRFFALKNFNWQKEFPLYSFYCSHVILSSKWINSLFSHPNFFNANGVLLSNHSVILWELLLLWEEKYKNIIFLTFLWNGYFLNYFFSSLFMFSRVFLSCSMFRPAWLSPIFFLILYYSKLCSI